MARNPKPPEEPEEMLWTPESIRGAIRKLRRRLSDVEAFDPQKVTRQFDPQVTALETSIRETLADVFRPNSRSYRNYQSAASLDTAGINMNGTPLHRVIEGLVRGKERSITLINGAIRFFEEKMEDDFPGEPLDQVALSGGIMMAARGIIVNPGPHGPAMFNVGPIPAAGTAPQAVEGGVAGEIRASILSGDEVRSPSEAPFELLMARVALLEAAISAPKPIVESSIGIGHNRGPDLVLNPVLDEAEIQEFVALLKQQSADAPVDLPKLLDIVTVIEPANNKWRERLDELAKSALKGAGEEIGKRLIQAPWWIAVYSALDAVGHALMAWLSALPV
jgi:hypothetical protein